MTDALHDQLQSSLGAAYRIERELGGGGMSRVFVAREVALNRDVVVKVLAPELAEGLSAGRFAREIQLVAALQEPHIVPVLTAGTTSDGLPWYTMPFVRGESLRRRIERGPLTVSEAVSILRDIAHALAYAHEHGVVHRDIKPENVLLSSGTAVVTDFGIAKALQASRTQAPGGTLTQIGTSLGTPAYMAPEQAVGDVVDHRADIYAWGVVAYELLTGVHPFAGRTTAQQFVAAHIAETPRSARDLAPAVPAPLAELVMRALEKTPEARPGSAAALLDQLDGVHVSSAKGDAPVPRAAPRQTHRARILGTVALGVLAVAAMIFALVRNGRPGATSAAGPDAPLSPITTVAVLPFENIGGDATDEYFSDGMTDELAEAIAGLPGLRIAGRTSSFSFKGKRATAQEVGRVLNVEGVISGTVRRAGDRLRIRAELTSAKDDVLLWSKTIENSAADVFQVQDEVTAELVAALAPMLRGQATVVAETNRGTSDPEAYDLYLRGHYFWVKRGGANLTRAIEYFQRAIDKDPTFGRAHAGLALAYMPMRTYVNVPPDSMSDLAIASATRALALDSTLGDAHAALGYALNSQVRLREAESSYLRAIELDPANPNTRHWHAINLNGLGLVDSAYAEAVRAEANDPMSAVFANHRAITLLFMGRLPEAIAHWRKAVELDSTLSNPYRNLASAYILSGTPDSAVRILDRQAAGTSATPLRGSLYLRAYAVLGRWADIDRLVTEMRARGMSTTEEVSLALVNGDHQAAISALERGLTAKGGLIYDIVSPGCDPLLQPLHAEPRYQALMARLGIRVCTIRTPWPVTARPSGAVR